MTQLCLIPFNAKGYVFIKKIIKKTLKPYFSSLLFLYLISPFIFFVSVSPQKPPHTLVPCSFHHCRTHLRYSGQHVTSIHSGHHDAVARCAQSLRKGHRRTHLRLAVTAVGRCCILASTSPLFTQATTMQRLLSSSLLCVILLHASMLRGASVSTAAIRCFISPWVS